ncbi:MAG: hypothetical protein ABFD25_17485 [Clostridiaceae bacterium]
MLFDIAGILMNFKGMNDFFVERCSSFIKENDQSLLTEKIDMDVSIEKVDHIKIPEGDLILDESAKWLRKKDPEQGYFIYMHNRNTKMVATTLEADPKWKSIKIQYIESDLPFPIKEQTELIRWDDYRSFQLAGITYRNHLLSRDSITIHSSAFAAGGKGVIISAPSGTGKSTHARLWKEFYGDEVVFVNDDRPAIRFLDHIPMLCGTPWSGSTDVYSNMKVPLNCIVMLEQSPINSIEQLEMERALQLLMPRCFLPYFDKELMDMAIITLENLIRAVPVYLLKCRPDYEAVELVWKCLNQ